jgi:thiol-disulfide isomerase/thioredoxin
MKKLFVFLLVALYCSGAVAQNFKITLQTPDYKSGIAYLAYHMGPNLNAEDSAAVNDKGIAVFTGKRILPGGIYAIVFPGKNKTVDFFIDKEQVINIKADTTDLLNKTVVTGSKENVLFDQYQKTIAVKGTLLEKERTAYINAKTKKDSALHEATYIRYNKELNAYRDNLIKTQPNSMMSVLLRAMKEPEIPIQHAVTRADSLQNYNYYKAHYWDGVTFMDERVIRTPFFLPKLERYYREVLAQSPDTIIRESDYQLLLARTCPEMYKFLLNWLTDEYFNPKYMGLDAVFVHLFENYHSKGVSTWLNEKQQAAISRQAYMVMSNLIGLQAADLQMLDTADKHVSLYDVAADYTVVCFWDPTCSHCKEQIPKIDSVYEASWKAHNVKIFAVLTEDVHPEWIKYIHEHNLQSWTNAYVTKDMEKADAAAQKAGFRQLYDVTLTPTLFLLDKDKRIIAKKLTWEQINDLLQVKWKSKTN